jgi:hypothetical protein
MSYITGLVVGALKMIGRENVTEGVLQQIRSSCLSQLRIDCTYIIIMIKK